MTGRQVDNVPNPGSDEALEMGCTCPVMDNGHGKGSGWKEDDGSPVFWIMDDCPLHGSKGTDATPG